MTSLVYQRTEVALEWKAFGGDELLTCTSVAASAGRQGAMRDFGSAARAREFAWRAYCKMATAPVLNETIDIYWKSDSGNDVHPDNDDGSGDAAVSAEDKLKNLTYLGSIVIDEASATPEFVGSGGPIELPHRYGAPVFWNATADALSGTAADHGFILTPVPLEGQ